MNFIFLLLVALFYHNMVLQVQLQIQDRKLDQIMQLQFEAVGQKSGENALFSGSKPDYCEPCKEGDGRSFCIKEGEELPEECKH